MNAGKSLRSNNWAKAVFAYRGAVKELAACKTLEARRRRS